MNQIINCLKEHNSVINKVCRKVSVEEGLKIATELFNILNADKTGCGLAANQVGIDAQVAVVNVREPLILINPVIKKQWDEIDYYEGCLSFPKKGVHTKRYENVIVHTEQEEADYYFSGATVDSGKGTWEKENEDDRDLRLLEAVCVQHEVDHLNGITCMDIGHKAEPIKAEIKLGRNDMCHCGSNKKFKKCCINK